LNVKIKPKIVGLYASIYGTVNKYVRILRNIKKLGNFRKKASESDLFPIASDDVIPGKQTREQAIGVLRETLHNT